MATKLFVNVAAASIDKALVRAVDDMTPVAFPSLVIGDGRDYELYLVNGQGGFASFSGSGAYIPYIAIGACGYPSGGTAKWTFNGQQTSPLPVDVSPAALQAALAALSSIGTGNVEVAGVAGKYYVITFIGALAGAPQPEITVDFAGLTPASTVDISTITVGSVGVNAVQLSALATNPLTFADDWTPITDGWTGQLSTRTLEMVEAFAAAGNSLSEVFQVTVADPTGARTTYLKVTATIACTIINPESFAGADKPLLATQAALNAAVLGLNNFTREALASAGAGNTNVTRATTSRLHTAVVGITGAAGVRTISLLTTNAPNPGDTILLLLQPDATPGNTLEVRNATSVGTLLASIASDASARSYFLAFNWTGAAWQLDFDASLLLEKSGNLAGLADTMISKANLKTLFANRSAQAASFTVTLDDEGKFFPISTAGGPVVVTLPSAADAGDGFLIGLQKSEASEQVITTVPATITMPNAGMSLVLRSDGTNWVIVMLYDPVAILPTLLQTVENREDITGLVGGTATDLDSVATAAGATPAGTALMISAGTGGVWVLSAGTGATSVSIVRPLDFDAFTNPQVWELRLRGAPAALQAGDVLYFNGTNLVRLGIGAPGTVLRAGGGGVPEWGAAAPASNGISWQDVNDLFTDIDVTPAAPNHVASIHVTGSAGARSARLFAPSFDGAQAGDVIEMLVELPATAGITLAIKDNNSSATLLTFSSDDGGGSAQNSFAKFCWNGASWELMLLVSPTLGHLEPGASPL